tara:strand:- start:1307 stop:1447 length:141 start_codon:yes stop_codon:yes gene_type:complete
MYDLIWERDWDKELKQAKFKHNLKVVKVGLGKVKVVLSEIAPSKGI